jgi:hypothetical protein
LHVAARGRGRMAFVEKRLCPFGASLQEQPWGWRASLHVTAEDAREWVVCLSLLRYGRAESLTLLDRDDARRTLRLAHDPAAARYTRDPRAVVRWQPDGATVVLSTVELEAWIAFCLDCALGDRAGVHIDLDAAPHGPRDRPLVVVLAAAEPRPDDLPKDQSASGG